MERTRGRLIAAVVMRFAGGVLVMLALVLIPAGTLAFWEVWAYSLTLFVPMSLALTYLFRKDRALLERRMRTREKQAQQKLIVALGTVGYLLVFLVCGLDHRFGWSTVSTPVVILADAIVFLAYVLFLKVIRENSYASRTVEVESGQRVITTGPYAIIRHPMYAAAILIYLPTPIALGSWWAVPAALPMAAVFVARIFNEEKVLLAELPGYREYMNVTRYRLIPHLW